ncbi:MAG: type II toxin-antitoxin system RelE/ParE family toxin [Oscillospiraceae bacterium]|nr:type II toxin-antitoxin system RelE/ParE family toxin [Oscillospiraceae bacterium]
MTREFIYTVPFQKSWKAMGLSDDDQKALEEALLKTPQLGDVIVGTGGARKMRITLEGRGKSGGGRVIYVDVYEKEHLYLLLAYPKNVQDDLTPEQTKMIRKLVEAIQKE